MTNVSSSLEQGQPQTTRGVLATVLTERRRRRLLPYLFISPWLIGVLVFYAYPIVASLYFSFTNYDVLRPRCGSRRTTSPCSRTYSSMP
jgi:hypothetical protein